MKKVLWYSRRNISVGSSFMNKEGINKMRKLTENSAITFILSVCLLGILGLLFYINIINYDARMLDFDSVSIMGTAKEMYLQRSIFLSGWSYQSTMLIDSPELLVAFLYVFTQNVMLAQGLANCILIGVFIALVYAICKRNGMSIHSRIVVCILFLLPWGGEYLGYQYCMLTDTACYLVRGILQLAVIFGYQLFNESNNRKNLFYLVVVSMALCLSTISSGLHSYIVACLPILLSEILLVLRSEEFKLGNDKGQIRIFLYFGALTVAMMAGLVIKKLLGYDASGGQVFIPISEFFDNIKNMLLAAMYLMHILPGDETNIISLTGVKFFVRLAIFVLLVIAIYEVGKKAANDKNRFRFFLLSGILMNLIVLSLTKTTYGGIFFEYRYHIFTLIPGFILLGGYLDSNAAKINNNILYKLVYIIMPFLLCFLAMDYRTEMSKEVSENDNISEMIKTVNETNIDTVVIYDNYYLARVMNALDFNHKYVDLRQDFSTIGWGISYDGYEHNVMGKDIIFITDSDSNVLQDYHGDLEFLKQIGNSVIYRINEQKMDFISMLPLSNSSVPRVSNMQITGKSDILSVTDYPYTKDIYINDALGVITAEGKIQISGGEGIVMESPSLKNVAGNYRFTINGVTISAGEIIFRLIRKETGEVLYEYILENGENNIFECELDEYEDFCYSFYVKDGIGFIENVSIEVIQ